MTWWKRLFARDDAARLRHGIYEMLRLRSQLINAAADLVRLTDPTDWLDDDDGVVSREAVVIIAIRIRDIVDAQRDVARKALGLDERASL